MTSSRLVRMLATAAGLALSGAALAGPLGVTAEERVPTLGGWGSAAFGINNAGQVVGWSATTDDASVEAFLYSGGVMTRLPGIEGSFESRANGINELGQVVGYAAIEVSFPWGVYPRSHAMLWNPDGSSLDLNEAMGSDYSEAWGINDHGMIVGDRNGTGFVWTPERGGERVQIDIFPNGRNRAANNAGVVVGHSYFLASPDDAHRAVYDADRGRWMTDGIGPSLYSIGIATDINEHGMIVGLANFDGDGPPRAAIFTGRTDAETPPGGGKADDWFTDLGVPNRAFQSTEANAVNNRGWIVGLAIPEDLSEPHAFLWTPRHGMLDLNDLLPEGSEFVLLATADDINDHGQIVGTALLEDGRPAGFILTVEDTCPGDWNNDTATTVDDLLGYLGAFRSGAGDMDGDGRSTVNDLLDFLGAFRTGC